MQTTDHASQCCLVMGFLYQQMAWVNRLVAAPTYFATPFVVISSLLQRAQNCNKTLKAAQHCMDMLPDSPNPGELDSLEGLDSEMAVSLAHDSTSDFTVSFDVPEDAPAAVDGDEVQPHLLLKDFDRAGELQPT